MLRICKELFFRTQKLNYLNGKLKTLQVISGTGCAILYSDYRAWVRITATGINITSTCTDYKDIIKYPNSVSIDNHGYRHVGCILSSAWRPTNNMYYLSFDVDCITLRSSGTIANGVIVADFEIPREWVVIK